jgi:hypothetical protein
MAEQFETVTFNGIDLIRAGLENIDKGDVVSFRDRAMVIRNREDNWSLDEGITVILTLTQYKPFPYENC